MIEPVRTVAPSVDVVSLDEAKAHLRVDFSDDDDLITALVEAATQHLDGYAGILGRALITQTWRLDLGGWHYPIRLPLAPVQSVSLKYFDASNVEQTLADDQREFFSDALGPYAYPAHGVSWPSPYTRSDAVRVSFVAGYGDAGTDVPEPIRIAIKMHVASLYATRESQAPDTFTETPVYQALIFPYRRLGL